MATVKIIYRAGSAYVSSGTLYFRVIHKRRIKQIHTGHHVHRCEWDEAGERVIPQGDRSHQDYLILVDKRLCDNRHRLEQVIRTLDKEDADYSVDDIVERYNSPETIVGFISYCRAEIAKCRRLGNASAADHYQRTLNSFIRFIGEDDLTFDRIDPALIARYERSLKEDGLCMNTISYYMRKLRGLYNHAVDAGLTIDRQPFKRVYTGVAKTTKRAVTIEVVKSLKAMNLADRPLDAFARDVFLFSFYMCGMAPVDIAYLQKNNLRNGFVCYRRKKTSQLLKVKWTKEMEEIVARHRVAKSIYMLPLIKSTDKDERRQYLSATHLINRHLRRLGEEIGLDRPLTLYVARHSWASIAHNNNVPIAVISQGMGHDSEKTTRIYLASLDTSTLDKANERIIGLING